MGKAPKSVKKFAQKHLKSSIAHRRKLKPMKDALRRKEAVLGNKRRKAAEAENVGILKKKVEEMNVDELMAGDFLDDDDNDFDKEVEDDASDSDDSLPEIEEDEKEDFVDIIPANAGDEDSETGEDEEDGSELRTENKVFKSEIEKHKVELEKLKKKDPEFYEFLKEHDQELLNFDDDEDAENEDDKKMTEIVPDPQEPTQAGSLTSSLVDTWCLAVKEKQQFGAVRNLLGAFRSACHYGEGDGEDLSEKFNITSSHVFNKVMVFVLSEMDDVFKKMLHLASEKSTTQDLQKIGRWKKLLPYVKSYLGNALHVLNQMTDNRMLAFTLRCLKPSIIFLGELPSLARKYVKAALHFWGTGEGALPFIAVTFIRDMVLHLGTDYLELCSRGIYKQYVSNTKFINAASLPRAQFMANCVVELYGVDMGVSYQNAFSFIRQMAIILRSALTMKSKDAFRKVYCWQYVASLELWVKVVSAYTGKDNLQPLAYPLAQIIGGVARLVPTARYFPLRMQCAVLLNKLAAATGTFVPVSSLLLDMLEFKELRKPPTGGVGKAIDFQLTLKVAKPALKTRAFQEECVATVLEQLTEHLTQWSYAIAFPELALVPLVQLRRFMKETNVDRFRRQAKQLVDQIERNIEFVTKKRDGVSFSPKDGDAVAAFLKTEKESGASPLSQYCNVLRQRAKERSEVLNKSSMELKEPIKSAEIEDQNIEDDNGAKELFNKKWLREKKKSGSAKTAQEKDHETTDAAGNDEDVVEELLLSSDDDDRGDDDAVEAEYSSDEELEEKPKKKTNKHAAKLKPSKQKRKNSGKAAQGHKPGKAAKKRKHFETGKSHLNFTAR